MPTREPRTLATLNAGSGDAFIAALGERFEHAPWDRGGGLFPAAVAAVHDAMVTVLRQVDAGRERAGFDPPAIRTAARQRPAAARPIGAADPSA